MFDLSIEQIKKINQVKLLILDVDGVLTDGRLFFDNEGNEYKCFHARDGLGLKLLKQTGVKIAVISGRNSAVVAQRMENLGIEIVYQGQDDKRLAFYEIITSLKLNADQVAYAGDDLLDLPIITQVGFAISVQDANFAIKKYTHWTTQTFGGQGAVREICDLIMQIQGNYEEILKNYL
jgi:3-deoxy-D-manno-octulosonate 8-phosphate phosphatase (KDO 8-P phosphatase)